MKNKQTFSVVLVLALLVIGLYLNMPRTQFPDFDISIQVNVKVTSQTMQGS